MRRRDAQRRTQQQRDRGTAALVAGGAKVHTHPRGDPERASGRPWPCMPPSTREYAWLGGTPLVVPPSVGVGGPRRIACRGPPPVSVCMPSESDLSGGGPASPSRMCGDMPVGDWASVSACAFPKMETSPIIHTSCHIWQVTLWELTAAEATRAIPCPTRGKE